MSDMPFLGALPFQFIEASRALIFAFLICVAIESLWPRNPLTLADRLPRFWFILAIPLFSLFASPLLSAFAHTIGIRPLFDVSALPAVLLIVLIVVVIDFLSYWEHRFEHRFWWRIHSVHHATRDMHAAMNYGHPIQYVGEFVWITIPMLAFGLASFQIPLAVTVYRCFHSMFNHASTPLHLGPLRRIFVDNRYHRIHHSADPRHFGRNFGTIFTVWDQIFGTAYFPATDEWPATGVDQLEPPRSIGEYLAYPLSKQHAS